MNRQQSRWTLVMLTTVIWVLVAWQAGISVTYWYVGIVIIMVIFWFHQPPLA